MSNPSEIVARAASLPEAIGSSLGVFGGFVRCENCRAQWDITDAKASRYTRSGWPKCCGYSMRWWTARQVRDGEVPA